MKVTLLKYTNPDICEIAAKVCTTDKSIADLSFDAQLTDTEYSVLQRVMDYGHTSVSEHSVFTFGVEGISRSCSHQLVRNRIASYSQRSQRYVKEGGFEFITPASIKENDFYYKRYEALMGDIDSLYKMMLEAGILAEDARFILPNACSTSLVMTFNIRSLINFCNLRLCAKAQWEIRALAKEIKRLVCLTYPFLEKYLAPKCKVVGYCTEKKCCGLMKPKSEVLKEI